MKVGDAVWCNDKASIFHGYGGFVENRVEKHDVFKEEGVMVNFPFEGAAWLRASALRPATPSESSELAKLREAMAVQARQRGRF